MITNRTVEFESWYTRIGVIASHFGGSAADTSAWREDYDAGLTPERAWYDAWDQAMPEWNPEADD